MRMIAVLMLAAGPAMADTPLNAKGFERLTQGKTMTWTFVDYVEGIEQYLPDRRVIWATPDKTCTEGYWYPKGKAICFEYNGSSTPVCHIMSSGAYGISALNILDGTDSQVPMILNATTEPLNCSGPDAGVKK